MLELLYIVTIAAAVGIGASLGIGFAIYSVLRRIEDALKAESEAEAARHKERENSPRRRVERILADKDGRVLLQQRLEAQAQRMAARAAKGQA